MDNDNLVSDVIGKLKADTTEEKGIGSTDLIDKNIIKPDESESKESKESKVSTTISPDEETRLKKIAKIFGETLGIGKFAEGPEAKRLDAQQPAAIQAVSDKTGEITSDKENKESITKGLSKWLLLAAGAALIFEYLDASQVFMVKAIAKFKSWFKILTFTFDSITGILGKTKLGSVIGKAVKGITDIVGNIATSIRGFFTGMGDGILKWFKGLLPGGAAGAAGGAAGGTAKAGGNFLTRMLGGIGGKILKFIKFLPVIGGVVGLGFAYARFKEGDYGAATLELISAILSFIPGVGWVASALIDGALLLYDLQRAKDEKENPNAPKAGLWATIKAGFSNFLAPKLRYLPVIGGIMYMGDALSNFIGGQWKEGFMNLGRGILGFVGGKALIDGFSFVLSLFSTDKADVVEPKETGKSFISLIWEKVSNVVGEAFTKIKDWAWSKATALVDWFRGDKDKARSLSDKDKATLRKMGYAETGAGWQEYEASGWKKKTSIQSNVGVDNSKADASIQSNVGVENSKADITPQLISNNIPNIAIDSANDGDKIYDLFSQYHKHFKTAATHEINLLEEIRDGIAKLSIISKNISMSTGSQTRSENIYTNKTDGTKRFHNDMNVFTTPALT